MGQEINIKTKWKLYGKHGVYVICKTCYDYSLFLPFEFPNKTLFFIYFLVIYYLLDNIFFRLLQFFKLFFFKERTLYLKVNNFIINNNKCPFSKHFPE